ncbi:hypothetical protein SLS62_010944 [Diatrype stigma]|uniref:Major facilitator superfamily (MFS) profile domain-containing protein n=1 Tax=Diatrype stigma TaxID=117547 RepID=A0AAN9U8E5_9PEZI
MDHEVESKPQASGGEHVANASGSQPSEKTYGKTTKVQGDSHFHETVTAAPLDPWSKTSLQLYAILLVASLNATASGFDGSIFSSINAMPQYQEYFHHTELGSATGIIFMIYTIGNVIGSLFTGPICDHFGRRAGMATGAVLIMAGSAILTAAQDDSYLLGGRFLLGFGVSIGTSSAPMGKREQAAAVLAKYHGGGNMEHPVVQLELKEFDDSIKVQKAQSWWNYSDLVENHNACWRTLMNVFMSTFAQMAGNSVLTYYLPSMYTRLGVTSTERRLLLTFANSIVSCAGALAGSATNDWIGRRTKLWVGSIVLACLFGGVTGFSSQFELGMDPPVSLSHGGISMIFLFGAAYSFVYTPLTATYSAEVQANHTRAKGMGVVSGVWFFLGVETRGRTLEELDAVFDSKFPPKASLAKAVMVKRDDGQLQAFEGSVVGAQRTEV